MTLDFGEDSIRILTSDEAEEGKKKCGSCGTLVTGRSKYCGSPCRQAAYRHRKWAKEREKEQAARKVVAIRVAKALRNVDQEGLRALMEIGAWNLKQAIGDAMHDASIAKLLKRPMHLPPHLTEAESVLCDVCGCYYYPEATVHTCGIPEGARYASGVDLDENGRPF